MSDDDTLIPLGKISGVFGLQGWVKVCSDTDPREGIVRYRQWVLEQGADQKTLRVEQGKRHGKGVIAKLDGIADRDAAESLVGSRIAVRRADLPQLADDEYYWSDLIGIQVETVAGVALGTVKSLFATGANDVIVVDGDRERLIPWIQGQVIKQIDLDQRRMEVDWDPDF
ncbi:MAG TPA: ribosome maturation factor RimM [Gammaproteobacteria bacterium]|nr:ribosome maturation factor RimM [Gammaproteobacteria bacterium]